MSVFVLAPNENWICDRFVSEWKKAEPYPTTDEIQDAEIVWLLADWCWNQVPSKILSDKIVVASVHHLVPEKFDESELRNFKIRDELIDMYHVPCEKTREQVQSFTDKPIWVQPFWVNQDLWKPITKDLRDQIREQYGIGQDCFLVGSFQRDTEGHDLISPKLEKGPDLFCDAVEQLSASHASKGKEVRVLLAGWRRQYVMNRLRAAQIPYYYSELPPFADINIFYNILDLYVVAARYEGGPQAIVECACTQTPILSTDVGVADMILSPKSIFKPGNILDAEPDVDYAHKKVLEYCMPQGFEPYSEMLQKLSKGAHD